MEQSQMSCCVKETWTFHLLPNISPVSPAPPSRPWTAWAPARARRCILPTGKSQQVARSARSRSRTVYSGRGRRTSRASGCSPPSSCSGSRAWCPLYARRPTGTARALRCSGHSSASFGPLSLSEERWRKRESSQRERIFKTFPNARNASAAHGKVQPRWWKRLRWESHGEAPAPPTSSRQPGVISKKIKKCPSEREGWGGQTDQRADAL